MFADAQNKPFLQACIKESLRIFNPTRMGLPRVAGKGGITIGDRHFPEGTTISVNSWVIHHSKEIWGPDAREFRPGRWLEGEKSSALERFSMPISFLSPPPLPSFSLWLIFCMVVVVQFGLGYMSCSGQNLARIELPKICGTIVRDCNIRLVEPTQEWQWKPYFTVAPHSWPCFVERI